MSPHVCPQYLSQASDADLLGRIAGHRYVAGTSTDPLTGHQECLVEYCDPAIPLEPKLLSRLEAELAERWPHARTIVLRTSADTVLSAPWTAHLTYVRRTATTPTPLPAGNGVEITDAQHSHEPLLAQWLERALTDAQGDQGHLARPQAIAACAAEILAATDRRSFIALDHGRPVGHATVLTRSHDDVFARDYIELVDILIEPGSDVRALTTALVGTATHLAGSAGLPLLGHVVHDIKGETRRILPSLHRQGWNTDHHYWRRPTPAKTSPHAEEIE